MSSFHITVVAGGAVTLKRNVESGEFEAEVRLDRPTLKGVEVTSGPDDEQLGKEGARMAAIAILELCTEKIRKGETDAAGNEQPTMPGASA